jgi:hypothetical protein
VRHDSPPYTSLTDLRFDVTIGIAAITEDGHIVTVSDRMISYGDITQAEDDAALKASKIAEGWGVMFAGNDARLFLPFVDKALLRLCGGNYRTEKYSAANIKKELGTAYQELFDEQFSSRFLSRLGIQNIETFRKNGLSELGSDVFGEIYHELSKFDLGIQFLCHGHDSIGTPHIFEVTGPNDVIDHDLLKYAVIGSGYWMATASLRRRPLSRELMPTIYRLLEAKFSAETASGVGRSTTIFVFKKNGEYESIHREITQKIREIWQQTLEPEAPPAALEWIKITSAVGGSSSVEHQEQQSSGNALQNSGDLPQLEAPEQPE